MHDITASEVRTRAIRFERNDVAVYNGEREYPKIKLVRRMAFRVLDVTECGGCEENQFIHVGLRHSAKFITCPACGNILSVDDIFWVGAIAFRRATEEEEKDFNEEMITRALNLKPKYNEKEF